MLRIARHIHWPLVIFFYVIIFFCTTGAPAAGTTPEDRAVMGAMRQSDPAFRKIQLLRRTSVNDQLDVVLVLGTLREHAPWATLPDGTVTWGEQQTLGLFLQDRHNPDRVYLLHTEKGDPNCWARVERITDTDAVVSCTGDGYERREYRKFIYDVRAKALVRQFRYAPFSAYRIFPRGDGAVFIESDGKKR